MMHLNVKKIIIIIKKFDIAIVFVWGVLGKNFFFCSFLRFFFHTLLCCHKNLSWYFTTCTRELKEAILWFLLLHFFASFLLLFSRKISAFLFFCLKRASKKFFLIFCSCFFFDETRSGNFFSLRFCGLKWFLTSSEHLTFL